MNERYFEDASTWDRDVYRALERSRRRAWIVAGASAGFAGLALVGLVLLLPLKESVPYVITQDRETGYVEVARSAGGGASQSEALAQFLVVRYVTARETYDPEQLQANYELVYAHSSRAVWDDYDPLFRTGVPGNLVERYGRRTRVEVELKSVTFLAPEQAFVRFRTVRRTGSQEDVEHWAATVRFEYGEPAPDARTRAANPLGFEVVGYRRDQEAVGDHS
jgi:type IV secretion system protein VirB8